MQAFMQPVYIFGHKNPDTDSICSAIAYAYLKNLAAPGHLAARLGEPNRETRFVLDTFGMPAPDFLPHVYLRIQDVMTTEVVSAGVGATVYEVGELIQAWNVPAVPLLDTEGRSQGVVSQRSLVRKYLQELQVQSMNDVAAELGKIVETLDGHLLVGTTATPVTGNALIGAMSPETMVGYIQPGDLLLAGNREDTQIAALGRRISCLVLTGGIEPSTHVQQLARDQGTAIIVTPHDTFAAARLINLSMPAMGLLDTHALTASPESLVNDLTPELLQSELPLALVNDAGGRLVGIVTKRDLVVRRRREVILIDHSERSQSVDGIEEAEIVEIVDHHRLGGLETEGPLNMLLAPVGCTATLILRRYREAGVVPPREMAGMMVAAILSDTVLLKSPTTTPEDVAAVEEVGRLLGEEPLAFGARMYNAKFDIAGISPTQIAANDLKTYVFGSATVGIGQVEVGDKVVVLQWKAELLEAMRQHQETAGFDLMLLMVTDVRSGGTELLAVGRTRAVERAFGASLKDGAMYLPGVLSRKKQVVPPIAAVY